ncbi:hypothetical protein [Microbacterium sp. NPDC056569]|uniref:hypothetical protein n=1 Tax=Microbacterium sp. NPDC056569 TaxID=3345867 RepID=UPI0036703290
MSNLEMREFEFELLSPPNQVRREPRDARIPIRDLVTSGIGLGPIPFTKIIKTNTMVHESNRLGAAGVDILTPAEKLTRTPPLRKALDGLERVSRGPGESLVNEIKSLFARINLIDDMIEQAEILPVTGPNGERLDPSEAEVRHDAQRDVVASETESGSKKHLIRRRRTKAKEIGLLMIDYPVFLLAMFSLLNVSVRLLFVGDGPTIIMAVTAAIFALLGTLLFAYLMRAMGHRHRRFKNADGGVSALGATKHRIFVEQIITIAITAAAAAVMAMRIVSDGVEAEAPLTLTVVLAALFAVLVGVSGYVNYMSEFENGSEEVDRVQHLAAQLARRTASINRLATQRSLLIEEAGARIARLHRLLTKAEERAIKTVTTCSAEKAITIARSYHGSTTAVPTPSLASSTFSVAKEQAVQLAAHHATIKSRIKD